MYGPEIRQTLLERIADGESVRSICRSDGMPAISAVMRWLAEDESFREQYARAKEMGAEAMAEDILDIADNAKNDWMERLGDDQPAGYILNGDHVRRSALRIDARKWLLAKTMPKKYGDKVTQEHIGANGGPIETKSSLDVSGLSAEQLKAIASIKLDAG